MVEHEDDDASKFASSSMSSCLPLLVFHHHPNNEANDGDEMLMFSISKQSLHKNMQHGLLDAGSGGGASMCWATPQGWMLLVQDHEHDDMVTLACRLWNPFSGDELPLPDMVDEDHQIPYRCRCILSHKDPAQPGCVVVLFSHAAPELWYCHTTTSDNNSSKWRHCTYDVGNYPSIPKARRRRRRHRHHRPIKNVIDDMASLQGKIYFHKSKGGMCAIDFSSCTSTADDNNQPKFQKFNFCLVGLPEGLSSGTHWLVESQDQLFVVTIGFVDFNPNNIGAIEVHKMDFSAAQQDRWRRVHDIGDAVFLLEDENMAASCAASALGLKANQIFFMKNFMGNDGDLCIFDLETNSQEITQVHNREDLILRRKSFWIVPPS